MDIVDTFNHLIPSDQLDDSLLIGQNLECEASNEFGTGLDQLEDSLRNMLSDKDPMFGSASSQFNLLDNDDPNFQIAGAAELEVSSQESGLAAAGSELPQAETPQEKRSVGRPRRYLHGGAGRGSAIKSLNPKSPGRPGRKPGSKQQKTFLIQKGATTAQIRRDLHLGGRVDISDLDVGLWLSPVVVLRRLTVTVGGFRIELLPGPSYTESTNAGQGMCFEDGFSYDGSMEYTMLQDVAVNSQNATAETLGGLDAVQALANSCADDLPLSLGPYVNPNDVQAANGALLGTPCLAETKLNDQSDVRKPGPASMTKGCNKKPQMVRNNNVAVNNNTGDKEQRVPAKKQIHLKRGLSSVKNKLLSGRPSGMVKGLKGPQHIPTKNLLRGDIQAIKAMKQKQGLVSLKRRVENLSSHPASKIQRMQDGRPVTLKTKPLDPSRPLLKRTLSSDRGPVGNPGVPKPHSHTGSKPHHPSPGKPSQPSQPSPAQKKTTSSEDESQEKSKVKKTIIQRQKSRNSRSISVEEPQLFVPDNAPAAPVAPVTPTAKEATEATEESQAHTETVWDGSKSCGLCKKHHNNTFMVGCGRCDDWFHGDCVGLDLQKVQEMEKEDQMYVCLKCCAEETTKVEEPAAQGEAKPEGQTKTEAVAQPETPNNKQAPKQKPGSPHPLTSGGVRPVRKDSVDRRQSTEVKESAQRTGLQVKQESKSKVSPASSKKPPSVDEIRRSVRDSLKEILLKRLKEADFVVAAEKAAELAKKTERELFHFYKDTDSKYKSKYRSLTFNLKDTKNNVLFKRVLKGEISPEHLIRMSPEELASKELAAWRQRENRHTIEMIEKEQREVERRPITKITHKGEIEIESQEPAKAPEEDEEDDEPESDPKVPEDPAELPLQLIIEGGNASKITKDTTSLHKSHLFDLHCKICTGRMAQPVEEASTKAVKVATTVVKRQSTDVETKSAASSSAQEDDPISVLEESLLNSKVFSNYKARSDYISGRDDEAAFLAGLRPLWRGFLNMAAVAKMVTKVYPVSGVLDSLTEDLPDSIQVGGRISPQTVWDYLEKIRATGTKEVCLIRFSPETEEDEISYTLLYAYFSSRKRFGVVANNLKRVKDMYLIPLGAAEKVPHQLVPFDGPGLEANRPNLLMGLIIRQRPKRDFLPVDINETARFIPESKPLPVPNTEVNATKDEETSYLTSLTVSHRTKEATEKHKEPEDVTESNIDSPEKLSESEEGNLQESFKPLRFLPGVLRSWGGELPPLPDMWGKPVPGSDSTDVVIPGLGNYPTTPTKSPSVPFRLDRFVIKKREPKPVKAEPVPDPAEKSLTNNSKDVVVNHAVTSVSLKDKPPDVSTEAFLAGLPPADGKVTGNSAAPDRGEASSENGKPKEEKCTTPSGGTTEDGISTLPKPPPSGILKKCTAYPSTTEEKRPKTVVNSAGHPAPLAPQPVPVLNTRSYKAPAAQHGALHLLQADYIPLEESSTNLQYGGGPDPSLPQPSAPGCPGTYPPNNHGPQTPAYTPIHSRVPEYPYPPAAMPPYHPYPPHLPPQVPGNYVYPGGPPPIFPHPDPQTLNHTAPWVPLGPAALNVPPGLGYPDPSDPPPPQAAPKEDLGPESMLYTDPWDRQPQTQQAEDRDQYSRRRTHSESSPHGKKSRHHDHEKKQDRSHEDKHRDRSRHHGHSKEDRHGDRRKDRHHSDDHSGRHKDRHRHRRDSDHDKERRRSSKDGHS